MSSDAPIAQPCLRFALSVVAIGDLLFFPRFVADARASALADGITPSLLADLVSRPAPRWTLAALGIAAVLAFARRPGRLGAGLVALVVLVLFSTAHTELFGSPWRHTFYSGLCLAGWLLGLAVSRWRGSPEDESFARTGSTALLGAAYFNAGLSKLAYTGFDWLSGAPIQAIIVAQEGLVGGGVLGAYRAWAVNTPALAALFSIATVLFELGGPLLLAGPRLRRVVALGLLGMHLNIFALTNILYWEALVMLAFFGLWPELPAARAAPRPASPRVALAAGLLLVLALLAVVHQARRFTAVQAAHNAPPALGPTEAPASQPPASVARLGPFTAAETLVGDWRVDRLTVSERGVVVALAGGAGRAAFEITCAASPNRSPFDLEAVHIFYASDLPVPAFEAAGRQVQARVRDAAGAADPCAALARWREEAAGAAPAPGS